MIGYKDLPQTIQLMLEDVVSSDPYGLKPESLYRNIIGSLKGTPAFKVAEIMEVSMSLIDMIEELQDTEDV